jgi:hypothetical protein
MWLPLHVVASRLGVSVKTARRWCREHRFALVRDLNKGGGRPWYRVHASCVGADADGRPAVT